MTEKKPFDLLVVPDDEPPVLSGTLYEPRARRLASEVNWHFDRPLNNSDTIERIRDADAIVNIRASVQFDREVLSHCSKLKILSVWGTGVDHVDLVAASEFGITVSNTPGYGAPYVSEHALTLALSISRQIVQNDRHIRAGGWTRGFIDELYGKTLGVVGTGAIGQRMIALGKAIGMNVVAWTLHPTQERGLTYGVEFVTLEELLSQSDVVSIHVALSKETEQLIGATELRLMKETSILINTARGGVLDQEALLECLLENRIAGAGLDVFDSEPLPPGHPLIHLENVVLSPHVGGMAYNGTMRGLEMSVENLESYAANNPIFVVNK